MLLNIVLLVLALLACYGQRTARLRANDGYEIDSNNIAYEPSKDALKYVEAVVRRWAPLIWLAPEEEFFPSSVSDFLAHVNAANVSGAQIEYLPQGPSSHNWYLTTKEDVDNLLQNKTSLLYGRNPGHSEVPIYAHVTVCDPSARYFYVTYWLFFPYSQGKSMCTLGPLPIPLFRSKCLGNLQEYGSHVGDWEHMSLQFEGDKVPRKMYVSAHDAGAYYKFDKMFKKFRFVKQEVRKGIMQRPTFPAVVRLSASGDHPVLFAAKGSHGLWTAPGKHKYVRLPRLYDESGYGVPWETWKSVEIMIAGSALPSWFNFWGRWGNARRKCHPVDKVGIHLCHQTDGPTGIPLKKHNFKCNSNNVYSFKPNN